MALSFQQFSFIMLSFSAQKACNSVITLECSIVLSMSLFTVQLFPPHTVPTTHLSSTASSRSVTYPFPFTMVIITLPMHPSWGIWLQKKTRKELKTCMHVTCLIPHVYYYTRKFLCCRCNKHLLLYECSLLRVYGERKDYFIGRKLTYTTVL